MAIMPVIVTWALLGLASSALSHAWRTDDESNNPISATVDIGTGVLDVAVGGESGLALKVLSIFDTSVGLVGFGSSPSWNVSVTRVSESVWTVMGVVASPSPPSPLLQIERTVTVERWRVSITDEIHVGTGVPSGKLGLDITHMVQILGDRTIVNATVPGSLYPYACSSLNEQETTVDPKGPRLHRGTFGNPTVHVQTAHGGVGLLPIDDVFELHAFGTQSAIAKAPGWPGDSAGCPVTSPPSLSLRDKYMALAAGGSHVMEWAIYPEVAGGATYWHFINDVRADVGADQISIPGAGYLGMYPGGWHEPFMADAGYPATWEQMTTDELRDLFVEQAMYHVHASIPLSGRHEVCRSNSLYCHGSCFVNELPPSQLADMHLLINRTQAADPSKSILLYSHSMISAETNASAKYSDSWITNSAGEQVKYIHCEASKGATGFDYPLFFATESNSYGPQMMAYYRKVLDVGFSGVYHDGEQTACHIKGAG
jgi:hypothetical protein